MCFVCPDTHIDEWYMIWRSFMYNHVLSDLPVPGRWDCDTDVSRSEGVILNKLFESVDTLLLWDALRDSGTDYLQCSFMQSILEGADLTENDAFDLMDHISKISMQGWHKYRCERKRCYLERQRRLSFIASVVLYFSIVGVFFWVRCISTT
jgi:hypothetical protein